MAKERQNRNNAPGAPNCKSRPRAVRNIALGLAAALALGYGAREANRAIRAREAAAKNEKARVEWVRSESAKRESANIFAAKDEARRSAFTNSAQKLRVLFFGDRPLDRPQARAMSGITSISSKVGITSARVLRTIDIYEKLFFNPNFQRLSTSEKMRELDTKNMKIIDVANMLASQPADVRNSIQEMLKMPGKKATLSEMAGKEKLLESQGMY